MVDFPLLVAYSRNKIFMLPELLYMKIDISI